MRISYLLSTLSCFALVACSTPTASMPAGPPPDWKLASASMATGNDLQGVTSGGQVTDTIQGRSVSGPVLSLSVTGGHIRGTGNSGRSIDIGLTGNKGEGQVGTDLFSCLVTVNPDGSAHITGAMGIGNADWILSPKAVTGRVGAISYQLQWNGSKYEGQMEPGGYGFLQLPAVMASWSDVEAACFLSLILMGPRGRLCRPRSWRPAPLPGVRAAARGPSFSCRSGRARGPEAAPPR